jgi:hypothetical protein
VQQNSAQKLKKNGRKRMADGRIDMDYDSANSSSDDDTEKRKTTFKLQSHALYELNANIENYSVLHLMARERTFLQYAPCK